MSPKKQNPFKLRDFRGINPEYKATIPFHQGAKEILAWYRVEKSRQVVDNADDEKMDTIIRHYLSAYGN